MTYPRKRGAYRGAVQITLRAYPAMPLSDVQIRNLKIKDRPYKVGDFGGLFVLVKTSGAKSWRFKYRIDGREKLLVIGDYPAVTLAKARQMRDAAKGLCCTKPVRDSSRESSVVAGGHEQTHPPRLQDQELAGL